MSVLQGLWFVWALWGRWKRACAQSCVYQNPWLVCFQRCYGVETASFRPHVNVHMITWSAHVHINMITKSSDVNVHMISYDKYIFERACICTYVCVSIHVCMHVSLCPFMYILSFDTCVQFLYVSWTQNGILLQHMKEWKFTVHTNVLYDGT